MDVKKNLMNRRYIESWLIDVLLILLGLFVCTKHIEYSLYFVVFTIIVYILRIIETDYKIHIKTQEIYNVETNLSGQGRGISKLLIEKLAERDKKPLKYELDQLGKKRKFLYGKLTFVTLFLTVIQFFLLIDRKIIYII